MDRTFTDIMVDIETTGLQPNSAAIIQIGAVPFNYETMQIDTANLFKISLTMPKTRYWTDDTRSFWMDQNREVYEKIMSDCVLWQYGMHRFYDYAIAQGDLNFWCKGLNFDWPFIESYFNTLELPMPFNFRDAVDLRSFCAGVAGQQRWKEIEAETERVGDQHDALSDCLTQLQLLENVKNS